MRTVTYEMLINGAGYPYRYPLTLFFFGSICYAFFERTLILNDFKRV